MSSYDLELCVKKTAADGRKYQEPETIITHDEDGCIEAVQLYCALTASWMAVDLDKVSKVDMEYLEQKVSDNLETIAVDEELAECDVVEDEKDEIV